MKYVYSSELTQGDFLSHPAFNTLASALAARPALDSPPKTSEAGRGACLNRGLRRPGRAGSSRAHSALRANQTCGSRRDTGHKRRTPLSTDRPVTSRTPLSPQPDRSLGLPSRSLGLSDRPFGLTASFPQSSNPPAGLGRTSPPLHPRTGPTNPKPYGE